MIGSRAAGGTEKRRKLPSGATLLPPAGRLVHIGDLPTACRLANVLIHARQSVNDARRNAASGAQPLESVPHGVATG
eukprot:356058-Chlamydomonas_euryale.AAC.12